MESYRTEDEQVEALRRWWDENGRSTVAAIVIALAAGFGWQGWQVYSERQSDAASDAYQSMMQNAGSGNRQAAMQDAQTLKSEFGGTTYAQFAALHLARMAVEAGDLAAAESELRWVLGKADSSGDIGRVAQLRLARVVAAMGMTEQALSILDDAPETYRASFALARGDILLAADRADEALQAYTSARAAAVASGVDLPSLQAKLQHLAPVPIQAVDAPAAPGTAAASAQSAAPAGSQGE